MRRGKIAFGDVGPAENQPGESNHDAFQQRSIERMFGVLVPDIQAYITSTVLDTVQRSSLMNHWVWQMTSKRRSAPPKNPNYQILNRIDRSGPGSVPRTSLMPCYHSQSLPRNTLHIFRLPTSHLEPPRPLIDHSRHMDERTQYIEQPRTHLISGSRVVERPRPSRTPPRPPDARRQ